MFDQTIARVTHDLKGGARRLLSDALLIAVAGVIAAIGIGFLIAWASLYLSVLLGPLWSRFLMGFAFVMVAWVIVALRKERAVRATSPAEAAARQQKRAAQHQAAAAAAAARPTPKPEGAEFASLAAFTAAYVVAKRMKKDQPKRAI